MQVWVGWTDNGSYSDKWTDVEGVYATREDGQRAARAYFERELAERLRYPSYLGPDRIADAYRAALARDWQEVPDGDGAIEIDIDEAECTFTLAPFDVVGAAVAEPR